MIKYIMRKTIYKDFDSKNQDTLFQLVYQQDLIEFLCNTLRLIVYFYILMPILIANLCKDIQLTATTKSIVVVLIAFYFASILLLCKLFNPDIATFSHSLSEKIYFGLYTVKGNALSNKNLELIKDNNNELYDAISSQNCRGLCYNVCFEILKILKQGTIQFVAIKNIRPIEEYKEDDQCFTMHLIYVNNGWAFDTYSQRQFPVEKLYEIYNAKLYKSFSFKEIEDLSYDDFRKKTGTDDLAEWCNINDCSESWSI